MLDFNQITPYHDGKVGFDHIFNSALEKYSARPSDIPYGSLAAFKRYGIKLTNVNFDTTSKVMWGAYKAEDGTLESVEITFGYS